MIELKYIIALLVVHFVADFILQTDRMALGKSKSVYWLGWHVAVYTTVLTVFGWEFALVNGAAHFVTDWVSSRIMRKLWADEERKWFFIALGADQLAHAIVLMVTFPLLAAPLF